MRAAVLGTGAVGRALAARLSGLGHDVTLGTRDVSRTAARTEIAAWLGDHPDVALATFRDACTGAEIVLNAVQGVQSLDALQAAGADVLDGTVLLDLAIPLDLSNGLPPTLTIANDDSLGEKIQRAFPATRVVKSLHTVYYEVMVEPDRLPGEHSLFVAGDDADAKTVVVALLGEFGWPAESVIDLGGIEASRATEMYSRLFFALYAQLGTFDFSINLVRA